MKLELKRQRKRLIRKSFHEDLVNKYIFPVDSVVKLKEFSRNFRKFSKYRGFIM